MPISRLVAALVLSLPHAGCLPATDPGPGPANGNPEPNPAASVRILFVGNSLTYVNDLPGMVKALADSAGIAGVQTAQVAKPDYALEDHWNDGQAREVIAGGGWTTVVLQQGPSAVLANRENLRQWSRTFGDLIRTKGGVPALYQVWPQLVNFSDFDAASESYRLAAADVGGPLLAAGDAWRAAWRRDPSLTLYAADGLHPSIAGSYLAALTIVGKLFGRSVVGLPAGLRVPAGSVLIPAAQARLLQEAADEVNGYPAH